MITLRLDQKLEKQINNTARNLGEDLFGKYSSGLGNLSSDRKELIKSKIRTKRT